MTFPSVAAVNYSEETVDTSTHDVLLPASIASGDRLVLFTILDGASVTISGLPAGWSRIHNATAGTISTEIWEKVNAAGSETAFTYTSSASEQSVNRTWRVSNSHTSSAMEKSVGGPSGSASTANMPTITPSWGADDTLWVVVAGFDGNVLVTVYPTNFTDNQFTDNTATGGNGAGIGLASQASNTATMDPDSMTWSAASDFAAKTFGIRPAAAGAAGEVLDPMGMRGFFG